MSISLLFLCLTGALLAGAGEVIKIGTLAPEASPWGQVFKVWGQAVNQRSGGRLSLQFFYNGQQGDEAAMVGKIKAGQLDGATLSAEGGLSKIYKPLMALELPGVITSYTQLQNALTGANAYFENGLKGQGFTPLGWMYWGEKYFMSKGLSVAKPIDLRGTKPVSWRDSAIYSSLYQVIGGVTPVPLNIPEVLPQLNTGAVNVVPAQALLAEQLQWTSKLDTFNNQLLTISSGGIVVSSARLRALPADLQAIVTDTGKIAANALCSRIQAETTAAINRLKAKMTVVLPATDGSWATAFATTRSTVASAQSIPTSLITYLQNPTGVYLG